MISRRVRRVTLGFLFVFLATVVISASVARYFQNREERRRYEEEKAQLKPPELQTHLVTREKRQRMKKFSASVDPWAVADVPAEVTGRVTETLVEAGQVVRSGAPMVKLDQQQQEIRVRGAEARLKEQERLLREISTLAQRNVSSRTELEAAMSRFEIEKSEYESAKDNLERHTIRAPFDGVVNKRFVDVGDPVSVMQPVVEVVDIARLRVIFHVSEQDVFSFSPGRSLRLTLPALPGKEYFPKVDFVSRSADPKTRLYLVEAVLENPDGAIPGGLQGIVEAETELYELPFVPAAAVRIEGGKPTVLILDGEKGMASRFIEIGPEIDGFYPVLKGMREGERVVIR